MNDRQIEFVCGVNRLFKYSAAADDKDLIPLLSAHVGELLLRDTQGITDGMDDRCGNWRQIVVLPRHDDAHVIPVRPVKGFPAGDDHPTGYFLPVPLRIAG